MTLRSHRLLGKVWKLKGVIRIKIKKTQNLMALSKICKTEVNSEICWPAFVSVIETRFSNDEYFECSCRSQLDQGKRLPYRTWYCCQSLSRIFWNKCDQSALLPRIMINSSLGVERSPWKSIIPCTANLSIAHNTPWGWYTKHLTKLHTIFSVFTTF